MRSFILRGTISPRFTSFASLVRRQVVQGQIKRHFLRYICLFTVDILQISVANGSVRGRQFTKIYGNVKIN